MSKASEWVHARGRADALTVCPLDTRGFLTSMKGGPRDAYIGVHLEVISANGEPALKLTDIRMDGLCLDVADALQVARWILAIFGTDTRNGAA